LSLQQNRVSFSRVCLLLIGNGRTDEVVPRSQIDIQQLCRPLAEGAVEESGQTGCAVIEFLGDARSAQCQQATRTILDPSCTMSPSFPSQFTYSPERTRPVRWYPVCLLNRVPAKVLATGACYGAHAPCPNISSFAPVHPRNGHTLRNRKPQLWNSLGCCGLIRTSRNRGARNGFGL
jgi:hypothetical protein